MDHNQLIGGVAAAYFASRLRDADTSSTARYLLDSMSAEQTAAIAKAILANANLAPLIEMKFPARWLEGYAIPASCLTEERATYFRNAPCAKPVLLVATPGDDERQSLADLIIIDSNQLRSHVDLWVQVAAASLPLTNKHRSYWEAALTGLQDVAQVTLDRFAQYVLETRHQVEDGRVFLDALGEALPTLRWPRNPAMFRSLNEKTATHVSKWKALFQQVQRRQACYLKKYTPSNQLLSADDLKSSFEKVKDVIPDEFHPTILAFIASPSKWNPEAEAVARIEWETIKPLFDGLRPEPFNLGKATRDFYGEYDDELLKTEEREYLDSLATKRGKTSEPVEDDIEFYRNHRGELKNDPVLKSKWDKFIFGSPIETQDLLVGLAMSLESLFDQDIPEGSKRELRIISDKRNKSDLRKLNVDAGRHFAFRYRGLRDLLGRSVFDVGSLFDFDKVQEEWASDPRKKYRPNVSMARAALEIKFYVELSVDEGAIENHRQVVWRYDPNAISAELYADWQRLIEHPLTLSEVARESVGQKGQPQPLDLRNVKSLSAAFSQDRGSLIPVYRKDSDLGLIWTRNLDAAISSGTLAAATASELDALFSQFAQDYTGAIAAFAKFSVAASEIEAQFHAYARLLGAVIQKAKGDRNRDLFLRPLLGLGVVPVLGAAPAAVVAPWNPLRMQAMSCKTQRMTGLIHHLLKAPSVLFGDASLYFKEIRDELEHPYFPEIALGWRERKPELLSMSDTCMDYSLHELPLADDGLSGDTNENPAQSANQIVEMVQRYLALFPHEQANLSAVLYNCDSASLPQAVVNRINELHEDDGTMRCEVILRHRERMKLHKLYESILEAADADSDDFVSSEASRDFMARLRIGIMADEAPAPDPRDGPRTDLVFLHDVIARRARIEWYREDSAPVDLSHLVPSRWSRRRPSPKDEEKSIVYLCCPAQTKEGWAYVSAIASYFKPDWDTDTKTRYLPARQLDFHDPETSKIFEETHNLGNWVINFDELLDRRQLVNQGVKVIRYKQSATQGRNLLVSSNASLGLLQTLLHSRIRDLVPDMAEDRVRDLAKRFIDDANLISGDIVLRAAKRGRNASELMGVVLSHFIAKWEMGQDQRTGCYFLDDYSDWLGQREQHIADLLILKPEILPNGDRRLSALITEAKYVQEVGLSESRKQSQKQLRDTVQRIEHALFGDPERLDRDLWLSRFSDLLLSGIPYTADEPLDLIGFRRAVREGKCPIYVRGYSHVFVSGPADGSECSDFVEVAECKGSYQEVYSRSKTRALVIAYANATSPEPIRTTVIDTVVLRERRFRTTSGLVTIEPTKSVAKSVSTRTPSRPPPVPINPSAYIVKEPDAAIVPSGSGGASPQINSSRGQADGWLTAKIATVLSTRTPLQATTDAEQEWLRKTVATTRAALQQFQLSSKLVGDPRLTPNAATIRLQGAANMTVELVQKRRSEFLTTHGLDLISARGEPGVVALSIARPSRQVLHTLDVWKRWTPNRSNGNHKLLIGVKEEDSGLLFMSPTDNAPHTLIAGMTGSGKSVLMQNVILAIACTNTLEQARILLIDPKLGVDYFAFEGLPHIGDGLIENQQDAIAALSGLLGEMDRRYAVLKQNRCSNIFELNRKPDATEHLPCLWIIHDEFAEWMMTDEYSQTVSNVVSRLGVKARAAGIFLIFAAQRPDSHVMPMQLRSNLGNRLVLRVDSEATSEIALGGERGAERLLGRGHMVAKLEGNAGLTYCQVPLISSDEIRIMVDAVRP